MHTHTHTHTRARAHTQTYTQTHTYTHTHTCTHRHTHAHKDTHTHKDQDILTHIRTLTHKHTHALACTDFTRRQIRIHLQIHIHTYTFLRTHTYTPSLSLIGFTRTRLACWSLLHWQFHYLGRWCIASGGACYILNRKTIHIHIFMLVIYSTTWGVAIFFVWIFVHRISVVVHTHAHSALRERDDAVLWWAHDIRIYIYKNV